MQVNPNTALQTKAPIPALASGVKPEAASSSTSSSASSASGSNPGTKTASITANDFLKLLVTEMKNQDPTANTDPNEYVNQLVQVNTLQQQIQMNQTLDGGPSLTGAQTGILQQLMNMNQAIDGGPAGTGAQPDLMPARAAKAGGAALLSAPAVLTRNSTGNLSAGAAEGGPAAKAVATALTRGGEAPAGIPKSAFAEFAARLKSAAGSL